MTDAGKTRTSVLPSSAYAEVLYGCNIRCSYCYIGEGLNHTNRTIPSADAWAQAFGVAYSLGVDEIIFLGGEPLMHPQLEAVLAAVDRVGFRSRGIVTNGTSLTVEKVRVLKQYGFWVDITLRASNETTWATITGSRSSWKHLERGTALLASSEIPVAIEFDCTPQNFRELYDTAAWVVRQGLQARHFQLHRILPMGDAEANYPINSLSPRQWNEVFDQANKIEGDFGIEVLAEDGLPFCLIDPSHWHRMLSCACGHSLVTISPDFSLRRCACDQAAVASLFDSPTDIQNALQIATAGKLPDPCVRCPAVEVCRGGCTASIAGSNGQRPDYYVDSFLPVSQATWQKYGLSLKSRRITGQQTSDI